MYEHDPITEHVLQAAIAVHRELGPGLLESVYEHALCVELRLQGLSHRRQVGVPIVYKGELLGEHLHVGLLLNFNTAVMKDGIKRLVL